MKEDKDRRRHQRLGLRLTVLCQKVGQAGGTVYAGNTINVSPGGVLAEFGDCRLEDGELVSIDMTVPPTEALLDTGGGYPATRESSGLTGRTRWQRTNPTRRRGRWRWSFASRRSSACSF